MGRHGLSEDCDDNWSFIKWRGQVASATKGARGQRLFRDLKAALEAMPEKRLVAKELEAEDGSVCTLGALGKARGMRMTEVDPYDTETIAGMFDVAPQLVSEIEWMNDEFGYKSPEDRYEQMLAWVSSQIKPDEAQS